MKKQKQYRVIVGAGVWGGYVLTETVEREKGSIFSQ